MDFIFHAIIKWDVIWAIFLYLLRDRIDHVFESLVVLIKHTTILLVLFLLFSTKLIFKFYFIHLAQTEVHLLAWAFAIWGIMGDTVIYLLELFINCEVLIPVFLWAIVKHSGRYFLATNWARVKNHAIWFAIIALHHIFSKFSEIFEDTLHWVFTYLDSSLAGLVADWRKRITEAAWWTWFFLLVFVISEFTIVTITIIFIIW